MIFFKFLFVGKIQTQTIYVFTLRVKESVKNQTVTLNAMHINKTTVLKHWIVIYGLKTEIAN